MSALDDVITRYKARYGRDTTKKNALVELAYLRSELADSNRRNAAKLEMLDTAAEHQAQLDDTIAALRAQLAEAEADAERLATELDGALSQDGSCIPTQSEALAAHAARKEGKK